MAVINGERAAFHAPDFIAKFTHTRCIQLQNMINVHEEGAVPAERSTIFSRITRSATTSS